MGDLVECSCQNHVKKSAQNYPNGVVVGGVPGLAGGIDGPGPGPGGGKNGARKGKNGGGDAAAGRKVNTRNTRLITSYRNVNSNFNYNSLAAPGANKKDVVKSLPSPPKKPAGNGGKEGTWEWGGCDDNVNFGFRKSKDFLDARLRKKSDIRTLVKLHNNNAGRLVSYWEFGGWFC